MEVYIDKQWVAKRFNRAAFTYDEHAVIQRRMAYQLLWQLRNSAWCGQHILEIGCGTGYLTQLLLDYYPEVKITAVDLADNMVQLAREKVSPLSRVQFIVEDAEEMEWKENSFDLIISNATIHWFQSPLKAIRKWRKALTTQGALLLSTYGPDTLQELADLFRKVENDMGVVPGVHILPFYPSDIWEGFFRQGGYADVDSKEKWLRQLYPSCRDFLYTIKATGESFSDMRRNIITSSHILQEVMDKYSLAFRWKKKVYATYHMIFISGRKTGNPMPKNQEMY
ncbi:malonyl-ACP O-methyltransferase BioC [Thermoflavimicrobium dichotomicum]|uniref:Malonyl-[acyl-carrier protein] O-methyltransferase n=1 Tax=Thermoflavimicrobium dichotomicum TaxID=46223 RepID=A0A1I3JK65_9BACL|nr:malonyl-ACP O-methyltransferase BioC [Thermoflavimicrobium dichotomicum]SFI60388.1 malonyl-CoA O-methyltransferase [Thermoflavimicrobium dichotomicum]